MSSAVSLPVTTTGKSLFSQHYLETRLPAQPEWLEDPQPALDETLTLWRKAQRYGATWNEAQTEDEFVKPLLAVLGWSYIPQVKNNRSGRINRPDYALFADEASKDAAYLFQGQDDAFYSRSLAIAEAKYWGRPLSRKDSSGRDTWKTDNNPSHQMVSYLVGTRRPWGILTNGRVWRLYSREVSSTASEYYEVDLGAVLGEGQAGKAEAFRRFWLFFRRAAFTPDSQGRSFVQRIHEGSASYALEISDKLKELVFEEVMPEIATGFVAHRREQLGVREETTESLREVYRGSLSLLYKLLFVLYAEARSLLPVDNPAYWEESLTLMARQFAERIDRGLPGSDATHATRQYDSLLALFGRIDQGDPSLGVPHYDGGLFNPATPENQFLAQHKLSDRAVARAVDILVRDAGQPVDYGYISVRNLGSIYEGLLENVLAVDAPRPSRFSETLKVSLVNDKGERKATGSFYTPDFIVEYNVSQTLDPILEQRAGRFAAAMDRIASLRKKLLHTLDAGANQILRSQLARAERDALEAFLGIKVCDPAMGSGHFLVNAVDHLTDGIIQRMQAYHDSAPDTPWDWNPIQRLIERVRQEILAEMGRQGIAVDPARLDDTALLTRLVMKRCIYGVDLNPLAVELAKLSLWLHSFTVGAPLSFLDHHLRWGNSLVGADVRTVERAISQTESGQLGLFGGPFAGLLDLTTTMLQIAERADATLADVRQSAEEFSRFQAELTPYKQALDLWVSQHFGNKAGGEFLALYGDDVLPAIKGQRSVSAAQEAAIEQAKALWQEKRFFHWDLEFPEVFVDLERRDWAEDAGFDAVVGNPPYVRQEWLAPFKPYFAVAFAEVYQGTADLFVYFFAQGLRQLRGGGRLAYVASNSWLRANYATRLRAYLRTHFTLETLVDLGDNRVFVDAADVYPAIPVVQKALPAPDQAAQVAVFTRGEGVRHFAQQVAAKLAPVSIYDQPDAGWHLGDDAARRVFGKLMAAGKPLGQIVERRIYRGILTGLNEAYIVDQATRDRLITEHQASQDILKPLVNGEDVRSWYVEDEGRWLILLPDQWTNGRFGPNLAEEHAWKQMQELYPSVAAHLASFADAARKRADRGAYWWELRPCSYYGEFDGLKVFWPEMAKQPRFALAEPGIIGNKTTFMIPGENPYLLGLLMSRSLWFAISHLCVPIGERKGMLRYTLSTQFMSRLPIPDALTPDRDAIASLALAITGQAQARYALHRQTRHRILTDLGAPGRTLNQKLTAWWALDFPAFLAQVHTAFKRDIPLRQRDDWEEWLAIRRAEHEQRTAEIVRLETELNARVYTLFDLSPAEIKIIEESTKYRYGEV